jgi:hypothetical protein
MAANPHGPRQERDTEVSGRDSVDLNIVDLKVSIIGA